MKYIRTKETEYGCIIDTTRYKEQTGEECYIPEDEIVKQADTIEEVCDEFLARKGNYTRWWALSVEELKQNKDAIKGHLLDGWNWYGAIWTDKGLIFVACMNNEGVFELL